MNLKEQVKNLLSKTSDLSSKRFIVILLAVWGIIFGAFYVVMLQFGGIESATTADLIEYAWMTAGGIAVGGTAAELVRKSNKDE